MDRTTRSASPQTTCPDTIPDSCAGAPETDAPGVVTVDVTLDMMAALLHVSPYAVLEWHTNGVEHMAAFITGTIDRLIDPARDLADLADRFTRPEHPGYPFDRERLAAARVYAHLVMDHLLTR